eukprot:889723-Amphidinium_carterae.2
MATNARGRTVQLLWHTNFNVPSTTSVLWGCGAAHFIILLFGTMVHAIPKYIKDDMGHDGCGVLQLCNGNTDFMPEPGAVPTAIPIQAFKFCAGRWCICIRQHSMFFPFPTITMFSRHKAYGESSTCLRTLTMLRRIYNHTEQVAGSCPEQKEMLHVKM